MSRRKEYTTTYQVSLQEMEDMRDWNYRVQNAVYNEMPESVIDGLLADIMYIANFFIKNPAYTAATVIVDLINYLLEEEKQLLMNALSTGAAELDELINFCEGKDWQLIEFEAAVLEFTDRGFCCIQGGVQFKRYMKDGVWFGSGGPSK